MSTEMKVEAVGLCLNCANSQGVDTDFKGLAGPGFEVKVRCQKCGVIWVSNTGRRIYRYKDRAE